VVQHVHPGTAVAAAVAAAYSTQRQQTPVLLGRQWGARIMGVGEAEYKRWRELASTGSGRKERC